MVYNTKKGSQFQNILLVAGDGRNVGKTYWCCRCIEHLSKTTDVIGVKISPHFHDYSDSDILEKTDDFVIIKETKISNKDSSLMLKAGAKLVYFLMCKKDKLAEAFEYLLEYLDDKIVVIESGGLHEVIKPGIFFFIKKKDREIIKTEYLKFNPVIINNSGSTIDFDVSKICIQQNKVCIK